MEEWATALGMPCCWGIAGAWNYGRGLAQYLVAAEAQVYEVNPRRTARERRRARKVEKSDRLDARAVALLVWREAATLPVVAADDETAVLELLVTEREGAVAEATRLRNQLRQILLQLDPEHRECLPRLRTSAGVDAATSYATDDPSPLAQHRAGAVRRLALRLQLALEQAKALACPIEALARARFAPLTQICGIDLLTAGTLAGIRGPGRRFATDAPLAAYAGAAPLETSSAERVRHRLNRGGNRRLNAILYRIVLTQSRHAPQVQAYLARRMTAGKTRREAARAQALRRPHHVNNVGAALVAVRSWRLGCAVARPTERTTRCRPTRPPTPRSPSHPRARVPCRCARSTSCSSAMPTGSRGRSRSS